MHILHDDFHTASAGDVERSAQVFANEILVKPFGADCGRAARQKIVLLQPMEVVTRASTSIFAVEDETVKKALQFIKENFNGTIKVEDICKAAGTSRSLLDKKFRQVLHRSPLQEIHRQRIERVRLLLSSTDRTTGDIALETGFTDPFQMYKLFKKKTGMTPRQYRKQNRH